MVSLAIIQKTDEYDEDIWNCLFLDARPVLGYRCHLAGRSCPQFYQKQLGDLMLPSPNLAVATVFYLFFAVAIVVLAVRPGLEVGSLWTAAGKGALLGLAAYGTYDITNLSTIKNWPVTLSVVDMIWGTVLTGLASAGGYAVARHYG
jgi:uncharacterized membrane protein